MNTIIIAKGDFKFENDINEELNCRLCGKDNVGQLECKCGAIFESNQEG